jgi:hypothetical protein
MHRNLNLQQQENQTLSHSQESKNDTSGETTREWISAYNTSVLTTLSPATRDRSLDLSKLMQSPEFASILVAAQHLADSQNLTKEEATDRLVRTFREMNSIWKKIVIERGLKAIID